MLADRIALVINGVLIARMIAVADYWGAGLVTIAALYLDHAITNRS